MEDASAIFAQVVRLPMRVERSEGLVPLALELAMELDRTVYDCLYLALAMKLDCAMLTADRRLVNALAGSRLERHVMWIGDG